MPDSAVGPAHAAGGSIDCRQWPFFLPLAHQR